MRNFAAALVLLGACASAEEAIQLEAEDEFAEAVDELATQFGDTEDSFRTRLCDALEPVLTFGDSALRAGFYAGVNGEAILGPVSGISGYDVVFDLYHQQFLVASYKGMGVSLLPKVGGTAQAYAGVAFGFQESVAEWYDWFAVGQAGVGVQIPFFEASINGQAFLTAYDDDGNDLITPDEVVAPPEGVYGFGLGVSVGSTIPVNPLPVDIPVTISEGYWSPHKDSIRRYYDRFLGEGLDVSLVDPKTGIPCQADWPEVERPGETCIVQFGDFGGGTISGGYDLSFALCSLAGGCEVPLAWPMSAQAIATAAIRKYDIEPGSMCD